MVNHLGKQVLGLAFMLCSAQSVAATSCPIPAPFKAMTDEQIVRYELPTTLAHTSPPAQTNNTTNAKPLPNNLTPTLLNFWASWCAPCRDELPFLQELSNKQQANIQLINVGDSREMAEKMLTELHINELSTHVADEEILSTLKLYGLPATLVFQHGQPRFIGVGKLKNEQTISEWLTCLAQPQ